MLQKIIAPLNDLSFQTSHPAYRNIKIYHFTTFDNFLIFGSLREMTRDAITNHLNHSHKDIKSKEKYSMYKNTLKTYYKCKICSNSILFFYGSIRQHVLFRHQMPLSEYKQQYMTTNEQQYMTTNKQQYMTNVHEEKPKDNKDEKKFEKVKKETNEEEVKFEKTEEQMLKVVENLENNLEEETAEKKKDRKKYENTEEKVDKKEEEEKVVHCEENPKLMCRVKCTICQRKAINKVCCYVGRLQPRSRIKRG